EALIAAAKLVVDGLLMLDECRPSAVLELCDTLAAHEGVLNPPEVDPQMRELVSKDRTIKQNFVTVKFLPLVGRGPRRVALLSQGMRRGTKAQRVQEQRLVVPVPPVRQESPLRLPPMRDGRPAVLGPPP